MTCRSIRVSIPEKIEKFLNRKIESGKLCVKNIIEINSMRSSGIENKKKTSSEVLRVFAIWNNFIRLHNVTAYIYIEFWLHVCFSIESNFVLVYIFLSFSLIDRISNRQTEQYSVFFLFVIRMCVFMIQMRTLKMNDMENVLFMKKQNVSKSISI